MRFEPCRKQDSWPVAQTVLSWLVALAFIACCCDWNFWRESQANLARHNAQAVYPGTPEYDLVLKEIDQIVDGVKAKASDKSLTLLEATEAKNHVEDICSRRYLKYSNYSTMISAIAKESFEANWQPPSEAPESFLQAIRNNPDYRKNAVDNIFYGEYQAANDITRRHYASTDVLLDGSSFIKLGKWAFKWYWLMTIPSLLILLINRRFKGQSVIEEFLLRPKRLLLACGGGPIGIFLISETAARAVAYQELLGDFRARNDYCWPTAIEEQALLRQLEEPLLKFEAALEQARSSSVRMRRPLSACVLAWLMGLAYGQNSKSVRIASCCQAAAVCGQSDLADRLKPPANKPEVKQLLSSLETSAILPALVSEEENVSISWLNGSPSLLPKPADLDQARARGPPAAAEGITASTEMSSFGCTTQKRVKT